MASPQPPYGHPGPSSYYQPPPHPHYVYGDHSPTPYQYQYPPPHMNGHPSMHAPASPRMSGPGGRGSYVSSRGSPSYQNFHPSPYPHPHHHQHHTPSSPYPTTKYLPPHPQYSPSYPMQPPPYPPTWATQQPLSPLPKQLSMPPPISPGLSPLRPTQISEPIPHSNDIHLSSITPQSPVQQQSYVGTIPNSHGPPHSSPRSTAPRAATNNMKGGWAIWSRRPHDPSHAPGIIISPRARPPQDVIQNAIELPTPPASPLLSPTKELHHENCESKESMRTSPEQAEIPSSSGTETTPACSTAPDTPMPGSPLSTNTSLSMAAASPSRGKSSPQSPKVETVATLNEEIAADATLAAPSVVPPTMTKPSPKSWASLLRPSTDPAASASKSQNTLPTSSVVGFSVQVADVPSSITVSPNQKSNLLALLTTGLVTPSPPPKIRPRGIINTGNMCFANSVLQILIYCPPFYRLFAELGKYLTGPVVGAQKEGGNATPLVDATIEFLKEFHPVEVDLKAKGKETDRDDDDVLESFIPTRVYDAMKEKKRFDNMRGGQQEDAEEFLGFYLDTLEEELLSIASVMSPSKTSKAGAFTEEREEEEPPEEDGWLEVGKRNRMVVTRTVKSAESPITRIFGGKFRSTLRAPQQKDSVIIEDWRALRLDIQREQIHTVKDALQYISTPSLVQVTSPSRPGVTMDANQQILIETLPPILVLHMKRFLYDTKVNGVVKIGKQVSFEPDLEIQPDIIAPARRTSQFTKYRLFGVLYHHGLSASGGHYTLDVLHPNRDLSTKPRESWIRIDDDLVSDVRAEDVFGEVDRDDRCAYLLFYRRIGGPVSTSRT